MVKWHLSEPHGIPGWISRWCSWPRVGFSGNGRLPLTTTSRTAARSGRHRMWRERAGSCGCGCGVSGFTRVR